MDNGSPLFPSNCVFSLDPCDRICFDGKADYPVSLKIKNISESDIAFKIKSNAAKYYSAYPSKGLMKPGGAQNIKISLKTGCVEDGHSFMILAQQVDENADLERVWQNPKFCQKAKLRVVMSDSSEEASIRTLTEENTRLETSLTEVIEELKTCRIKTLQQNCEHNYSFSYIHGLLSFIAGVFFGLFLPVLLNY